jgi:hypothetical protein
MDRVAKVPKLVLANWECGVLVPVPVAGLAGAAGLAGDERSRPLHEDGARLRQLFAPILDVPFELPGKRYAADDEPWYFETYNSGY